MSEPWLDFKALLRVTDYDFANPWVLWLLLALPILITYQLWPNKRLHGTLKFSRVADLAKAGKGLSTFDEPASKGMR